MKDLDKKKTTAAEPPAPAAHGSSRRRWLLAAGAGAAAGAVGLGFWLNNRPTEPGGVREYTYEVVNRFPHREDAFTQGLVYADGFLYEGTGGSAPHSFLRKVNLQTGDPVQQSDPLPATLFGEPSFGEGIVLWNNTIIQLTWQNRVALLYDRATLQLQQHSFRYETEGWGLTHDGRHLIMSDGTNRLYFRDPETFRIVREVAVTSGGQPVNRLNELEYIEGEVYANVWETDFIVRIAPDTGAVVARLNLSGLRPPETRRGPDAGNKVLNGIAWDAQGRRLFVTGKNWPALFEIRQVPV